MPRIEDIILRGTRAGQPAANAVATGSLYFVTDELLTERSNGATWDTYADATSGAAPDSADYLVGTSNGTLTNEIVVGTTPGGELGGTWGTPTVDATHSGSPHTAIPYTPSPDNDKWDAATDPGSAQDALDQLAARIAVLERAQLVEQEVTHDWERTLEQTFLYRHVRLACREIVATGNVTLTTDDPNHIFIDGGGSNRDLTLPTDDTGLTFFVFNFSDTEVITVKDASTNTVATLAAGEFTTVIYSGSAWRAA